MACNCGRKRQNFTRPAPEKSQPTTIKFPSGETKTYASKLEAYAAQTLKGGEIVEK